MPPLENSERKINRSKILDLQPSVLEGACHPVSAAVMGRNIVVWNVVADLVLADERRPRARVDQTKSMREHKIAIYPSIYAHKRSAMDKISHRLVVIVEDR